jgi:hypothetical protein
MSRKRLSKEEQLIAATKRRYEQSCKPPFKGGEYQPSPWTIRMWEAETQALEEQEKTLKHQNEFQGAINKHLREAHNLKKQALKREAGLKPANATERQKANARHQQIREIAADVVSTEKRPLRMTIGWLADKVQARATKIESLKVRGSVVSTRTIRRALRAAPSKKV